MRRSFPPAPSTATAVVLRAHPFADSFNSALATAWSEAAESAGVHVQTFDLHALDFDPVLRVAYRGDQPLEPDLVRVRDAIAGCAHLTVAYPSWWGSTPALLKGFFDRVFLPGWAFRYDEKHNPVAGLGGRSARQIVTMDAPTWYDALVYRGAGRRQVGRATLGFSGFKPVHSTACGGVGTSTAAQREKMLGWAREAGRLDGNAVVARFPVRRLAAAG